MAEEVCLRPDTLAALASFLRERDAAAEVASHEAEDTGVALLTSEDWQMSQFWYAPHTATLLADECARVASLAHDGSRATVAFISSPSAYKAFRARETPSTPDTTLALLEYDERFAIFGEEFHHYDYVAPLSGLPPHLCGACDVIMLDPPFLNADCLGGFAETVRAFSKSDGTTRVLLATGAIMLAAARELLGLRPTRARIEHADGRLSNPFCLYANYDTPWGWDLEAEAAAAGPGAGGEVTGGEEGSMAQAPEVTGGGAITEATEATVVAIAAAPVVTPSASPAAPSLPLQPPTRMGLAADALVALVRQEAEAAAVANSATPSPITQPELEIWSLSLVYGELAPRTVAALLELALSFCTVGSSKQASASSHAAAPPQRRVLDLGSGEGLVCVVAAALFPAVSTCRGVELVPRLHRKALCHAAAARTVLEALSRGPAAAREAAGFASAAEAAAAAGRLLINSTVDGGVCTSGTLQLVCDDFIEGPSADGWATSHDIVFLCGTCFELPELEAVYRKAESMKPGTIFITTTHAMPGRLFELVHTGRYGTSWEGGTIVRIYRRTGLPKWVAGIVGRR